MNIHTHMIPLLHTALRSVFKASVSLDQPEKIYTAFAMLCLFSSVVWHTMSGCAHRTGMELCARYVGLQLYTHKYIFIFSFVELTMSVLAGTINFSIFFPCTIGLTRILGLFPPVSGPLSTMGSPVILMLLIITFHFVYSLVYLVASSLLFVGLMEGSLNLFGLSSSLGWPSLVLPLLHIFPASLAPKRFGTLLNQSYLA